MTKSRYFIACLGATTAIAIVAIIGGVFAIVQSAAKERDRAAWNSTRMLSATVALSVDGRPRELGQGGGFIVDGRGLVLTNAQVINGATAVTVTLSSGHEVQGHVVRTNSLADLAWVQLSASDQTLMPLSIANSDTARIGQRIFLIGAPQEGSTIRKGTITGLYPLQHGVKLIQTDMAVRAYDAGSALVDIEGNAIGIVSATLAKGLRTVSAVSIVHAQEFLASLHDGPLP